MKKQRRLTIVILLIAAILGGCSSSDEDENGTNNQSGHPPAVMVGSWIFVSVTVDGAASSLATVQEWLPQTVQSRVHIQANSAYVYEEVNVAGGQLWFESGFVFIDGAEMDINAQQDSDGPVSETVRLSYTVNDSVLTLQHTEQGQVIHYTLNK